MARLVKIIASLAALLVLAAPAAASGRKGSAIVPTLAPSAQKAFESVVAGRAIHVDCSYADASSPGEAIPSIATTYVYPSICRRINSFARAVPAAGSSASYAAAQAILVLTHESVHLSSYVGHTDESLTECRAIQLVGEVAASLGASPDEADAVAHEALRYHEQLLAANPSFVAAGCVPGGPLDIHPGSQSWPS